MRTRGCPSPSTAHDRAAAGDLTCTHPPPHFSMQLCSEAPRFLSTWRSFRLAPFMMDHKGRTSITSSLLPSGVRATRGLPVPRARRPPHRTVLQWGGQRERGVGSALWAKGGEGHTERLFSRLLVPKTRVAVSTVDTWVRPVLSFNSFAWRNWLARPTVNREAVSSILTANEITFFSRRPTTDSLQGSASPPSFQSCCHSILPCWAATTCTLSGARSRHDARTCVRAWSRTSSPCGVVHLQQDGHGPRASVHSAGTGAPAVPCATRAAAVKRQGWDGGLFPVLSCFRRQ